MARNQNGKKPNTDPDVTEVLEAPISEEFATLDDLLSPSDASDPFASMVLRNGKTILLRGVTRAEMYEFRNQKMEVKTFEQKLLAYCMVEPKMTRAQVAAWQKRDPAGGDIRNVVEKAMALSGMKEEVTSKSNSDVDDQPTGD